MENSAGVLQKLKNRTSAWSSNPTSSFLPEKKKNAILKRHLQLHVHCGVIYIMEYYSAMKKKEILTFATTRMDLEGIMLSEVSQTEKDKYCVMFYNELIDIENRPVVDSGRGWRICKKWVCVTKRYKLRVTRQISSGDEMVTIVNNLSLLSHFSRVRLCATP